MSRPSGWPCSRPPARQRRSSTRLNREIGAGLQTDAVKNAFMAQGVETEHSTPEALGEILRRDIDAYREVASKAGIARH